MACKDSPVENTRTGVRLESNHGKEKKSNFFIKRWIKCFRPSDDDSSSDLQDYRFVRLRVDPVKDDSMEDTHSDISGEEIDWDSEIVLDERKPNFSTSEREERVVTLTDKMNSIKKELRRSKLYHDIHGQWKNDPEFRSNMDRLLSKSDEDEKKMLMVIYALGSIESNGRSQYQLALAILLKEDFPDWISSIESYDPKTTTIDAEVMENLGITVLSENENGGRCIGNPTLFYMPFAINRLKCNVFAANWLPSNLNLIMLLTTSCEYVLDVNRLNTEDNSRKTTFSKPYSYTKFYYEERKELDCFEALQKYTVEFPFRRSEDHYRNPFRKFSFHFFNLPLDKNLFDLLEGVRNRNRILKIYDRSWLHGERYKIQGKHIEQLIGEKLV